MVQAAATLLWMSSGIDELVLAKEFSKVLQAMLERIFQRWRVEHNVADLFPQIILILPADDAHRALELFAIDPQLAIQGRFWQSCGKPVGRMIEVSEARDELLAVPVGPHAVELLAHPPPREVRSAVPGLGKQQWRSSVFLAVGLRLDWLRRQRTPDPVLLGGIAAQFA